jgi:hypothetical protein
MTIKPLVNSNSEMDIVSHRDGPKVGSQPIPKLPILLTEEVLPPLALVAATL